MDIDLVIDHLRQFSPSFAGRFAGAAQFKNLSENTSLLMPSGFVIPLDDNPSASSSLNAVRQDLTDGFGVVVCLSNAVDERGQSAATALHLIRKELWKALLGWRPTDDYNGVIYEGGSLLQLNRAQLWYQYEFSAQMQIGPSDGWEEGMLQALPSLNEVRVKVDVIEPIAQPSPGPDGRIEFEVRVPNLNL